MWSRRDGVARGRLNSIYYLNAQRFQRMGEESELGAIILLSAVLLSRHGESGKSKPMVARAAELLGTLRERGLI